MGLASVFHSTIQPSLHFHPLSVRVSPVSTSFQPSKSTQFHSLPSSHSITRRFPYECYPIACSRGAEPDADLSTSEAAGSSPHTCDEDSSVDKPGENTQEHGNYTTSVKTVALCVGAAVAFGIGIGLKDGVGKASEFFAGYILEQSLSVDNLFVFVLIFKYFKVPLMYQNRVLSYGIAGAIIFRLSLILLGTATLQRFEAVNLGLAAILLYSSFKLFASEEDDSDLSDNFLVKTCQRYIPVTSNYDGNRFITNQDGVWKASTILDRPRLYF